MPYATAIVARFDHVPLRLACVNAGHPSGHLLRDGGASTLESGGPPLGLLPEAKYVASTVELQPGDIGVLVTDGITEALEGGPVTLGHALRHPYGSGSRRLHRCWTVGSPPKPPVSVG